MDTKRYERGVSFLIELLYVVGAIGVFLIVYLIIPRRKKSIWQTVHSDTEKQKKRFVIPLPLNILKYINVGEFIYEAKKVEWNVTSFAPLLLYGSAIAGGLFGWVLGNVFATVMGMFVGLLIPWMWLKEKQNQFRDYLEYQVELMISSVSSAYSLNHNIAYALDKAKEDVDEPLKGHLDRAVLEYRSGRPLSEIMKDMQQGIQVEGFQTFATIMNLIEQSGGEASDVIKNTARVIQHNRLLRAEMRTELADSRQEHRFLIGVAAVVLLFFRFMQPDFYLSFAQTVVGDILVGGLLLYVAWSIQRVDRITQV